MTDTNLDFLNGVALTELHAHMGTSISAEKLWEIAHAQGIRLPTKDFKEFEKYVVINEKIDFETYIKMHDLPEKIQSSPEAMLMGYEAVVSGAYRLNNIQTLELRMCPMFRTRQGERDLDYIIMYAIHGIERAMLKYPIKAGLILMMDKRLSRYECEVVLNKALKYKNRGVIGIDLAGPNDRTELSRSFTLERVKDLFLEAKKQGLGTTFHTGEVDGPKEMWEVIDQLHPDRIGHGIAAIADKNLMKVLRDENIVLEISPISNLFTKVVKSWEEIKQIIQTFKLNKVPFTINTDNPAFLNTTLLDVYRKLLEKGITTKEDLLNCNQIAKEASFIKN